MSKCGQIESKLGLCDHRYTHGMRIIARAAEFGTDGLLYGDIVNGDDEKEISFFLDKLGVAMLSIGKLLRIVDVNGVNYSSINTPITDNLGSHLDYRPFSNCDYLVLRHCDKIPTYQDVVRMCGYIYDEHNIRRNPERAGADSNRNLNVLATFAIDPYTDNALMDKLEQLLEVRITPLFNIKSINSVS